MAKAFDHSRFVGITKKIRTYSRLEWWCPTCKEAHIEGLMSDYDARARWREIRLKEGCQR